MAERILDMGDILSIAQKVEDVYSMDDDNIKPAWEMVIFSNPKHLLLEPITG